MTSSGRPRRPLHRALCLALLTSVAATGCGAPDELADEPSASDESGGDELRIGDNGLGGLGEALARQARWNRVRHWAPAVFMDVHPYRSPPWGYEHDYITKFNWDGDYNGDNNGDNFVGRPKPAYVYYSTVETSTHWFIGYYFFHPIDRSHSGPNDLEGVLLSIRRDGTEYGKLESWVTQSHGDTLPALNRGALGSCRLRSITPGSPIFGTVTYGRGKPAVYVEPHGHGVKDCHRGDCGNNDGVIYAYEDGRVETPAHSPEGECGYGAKIFRETPTCGYGLIPLEGTDGEGNRGFYLMRDEIGPGRVFQDRFTFRAGFVPGEANPPWQWSNRMWLENPAALFGDLVWRHLVGCDLNAVASRSYTHQPYRF